ncbi:hypothetical protein NMY22_g10536 [Coprinellus aureogranulatus]|nr:hypothetical protein NMY22_g10536 [Coprinellus aureogranulatus]
MMNTLYDEVLSNSSLGQLILLSMDGRGTVEHLSALGFVSSMPSDRNRLKTGQWGPREMSNYLKSYRMLLCLRSKNLRRRSLEALRKNALERRISWRFFSKVPLAYVYVGTYAMTFHSFFIGIDHSAFVRSTYYELDAQLSIAPEAPSCKAQTTRTSALQRRSKSGVALRCDF